MKPIIFFSIKRCSRKIGRQALIRNSVQSAISCGKPALLSASKPVGVSVVLTDDEQLHELNLAFRGYDKPTDVLSFVADGFEGANMPEQYLGDVIISMDHCKANAARADHGEDDELALLVVHGILHLLGFDHMNASDKSRMWAEQKRALKAINLSPKLRLPR